MKSWYKIKNFHNVMIEIFEPLVLVSSRNSTFSLIQFVKIFQ